MCYTVTNLRTGSPEGVGGQVGQPNSATGPGTCLREMHDIIIPKGAKSNATRAGPGTWFALANFYGDPGK